MVKFITTAAVLLLYNVSYGQTIKEKEFHLRIRIDSADVNTRVYLGYQVNGRKIIDSAQVKNGLFVFEGNITGPLNATLATDYKQRGFKYLISNTNQGKLDALKFYIHPGIIKLATVRLIGEAKFSGSVINADNERFKKILKPIDDRRSLLSYRLRNRSYIPSGVLLTAADSQHLHQQVIQELDSLSSATRPLMKKFILDNPESYIALQQLISYGGAFPTLALVEPMYNRLSGAVRSTPAGRDYKQVLLNVKNLVPGTLAPVFVQNDTSGLPVSLSSFKGRFVLIDFWASWCGPCRKSNPELVRIFNEFQPRNFTILGVSLDEADGKNDWLAAIRTDQLTWTQVSDLKHWSNEVARLYSIHSIPQNFLIDPQGIIVAKGINVEDLHKKLEEVLLNDPRNSN